MGIDSEDDDVLYSSNMGYDAQNRTLIGGEAKNLDEIMNKPKDRMKKTLGLCAAFIGLGLSVAVLGPTLRSFKDQVGAASMESMAVVFSGRGLGYLGGTIAGGAFFDCWNPQVLIAAGLGLAAFGMAVVAFTKQLPVLVVLMSTVGIAMGILDTGANVVCIKMWGKKSSAFLQMLHFGFALGALLAPLLATPFLRKDLAVNPNISCLVTMEQELLVCQTKTCQNGGKCSIEDGKEICTCVEGYKGDHCEAIECSGNDPCLHGGTCNADKNICICTKEFTGDICEKQKHCETKTCQNGGTCHIDESGEEKCSCIEGFQGDLCEEQKQCETKTCQNGGTCHIDESGEEKCSCIEGFQGDLCEALNCTASPCLHHGMCVPESTESTTAWCNCTKGFTGQLCQTLNCTASPCLHHGICVPESNESTAWCNCTKGLTGPLCQTIQCNGLFPCLNGGECVNGTDSTKDSCKCKPGFVGQVCQKQKQCETKTCQNGGTCHIDESGEEKCSCIEGFQGDFCEAIQCNGLFPCLNGGECVKETDSTKDSCKCKPGFVGQVCQNCTGCLHEGNCTVNNTKKICSCPPGFKGEICESLDCGASPCLNGGTCVGENSMKKEPSCFCPEGFVGTLCESINCTDSKPCVNGGQCGQKIDEDGNILDEYECHCKVGFGGFLCEECDDDYCENGGNCTVITEESKLNCSCPKGLIGDHCQSCDPNYCRHKQPCDILNKTARCICSNGFMGDHCEKVCVSKEDGSSSCRCAEGFSGNHCDECDQSYCQNGGTITCSVQTDEVTCQCANNFSGKHCEVPPLPDKGRKKRDVIENDFHQKKAGSKRSELPWTRQKRAVDCSGASPCLHGGTCVPAADATSTDQCNCPKGLTGLICETIQCSDNDHPCLYGGKCNTDNTCSCSEGFTGDICEKCDKDYCDNGGICEIKDGKLKCSCENGFGGDQCKECDKDYCDNGGTCEIKDGRLKCSCENGFGGDQCKECDKDYCDNGGTCEIKDGKLKCSCENGFGGDQCKECEKDYCDNGGTCEIKDGKPTCKCKPGYTGNQCKAIDCKSSPCLNNATCHAGEKEDEPGTCVCTSGFTGEICQDAVAPTGFHGVYIIISFYLASICLLFCYFTYISPISSEAPPQEKGSSDRPSYENQILMLLFCFYLIYVGSEVSFGGYISEYYQAVFNDCHGSLATAWFWGTFAFGRGIAICFAAMMTPMTMLAADLVGGFLASVILVLFGNTSMWFWLGTGLLGLSMASMFPAGIAWLEGYVDVSGRVASVLVTGGVLGEMLIPLGVGFVMFDKGESSEEQVYPERLMYLMLGVCSVSVLIFGYVYMLAQDMGLKNTHTNQQSVTDVIHGMNDAFSMRNLDAKGPKQMKKSLKIGKKHKL